MNQQESDDHIDPMAFVVSPHAIGLVEKMNDVIRARQIYIKAVLNAERRLYTTFYERCQVGFVHIN